jgi:acetyl esterase/lipase
MISDWDGAYDNAGHVADSGAYPARWEAAAAAFRAGLAADGLRAGLAYGAHPRQRVDLFLPEGRPHGLVVFVHGGYWRRFDRGDFSHLAAGPLARGWAVAMPGYVLVPEARIAAIGAMVGRAIVEAAATVPGPLRLIGHSAGGHLVARQVCADSALPKVVRARIGGVLSISGVHDLRPLLRTAINADLRMDADEAVAESPALLEPLDGMRLHAWVGADELPEFVRQTALIANVWTGLGAGTVTTVEPGRHHYDVIEGLEDAGSALVGAVVGEA